MQKNKWKEWKRKQLTRTKNSTGISVAFADKAIY